MKLKARFPQGLGDAPPAASAIPRRATPASRPGDAPMPMPVLAAATLRAAPVSRWRSTIAAWRSTVGGALGAVVSGGAGGTTNGSGERR